MAKARVDEAALLQELRDTAQAVGTLVAEPEAYKLTLAGLRAGDPDLVRRGLELVGLAEHCRLICRWFCSKDCVLLCLHLAGPPAEVGPVPDPRELADVVAKLTGDEGTLRRLATIVEERDERAYGELIEELQLHRFRYLLCHWLCTVRCRLRCRWICEPNQPRLDLFTELQRAGKAVRALAADPRALTRAVRAAQADDCEGLRQVVAGAGLSEHCAFICLWLCSWRCVTVCFVICRRFLAERVDLSDKEIEAFAHDEHVHCLTVLQKHGVLPPLLPGLQRAPPAGAGLHLEGGTVDMDRVRRVAPRPEAPALDNVERHPEVDTVHVELSAVDPAHAVEAELAGHRRRTGELRDRRQRGRKWPCHAAGWHGDVNGRIPLLHHRRALIMTSTIFDKNSYDAGVRDAIGKVLDEWAFRFPGIADVEHVYFYGATSASPELVERYFRQAYELGRAFDRPARTAEGSTTAA